MIRATLLERAAGTLLGQAVGDALGVPYEFGSAPLDGQAQMLGGGLGPYAPGEYSDDTQMAVCVAQVAAAGHDLSLPQSLDAVAAAFIAWAAHGASDIGIQTARVLRGADAGTGSAARLAARSRTLHEATGRTAGNGALMRTAVVGVTQLDDRVGTARAARAVAELTHTDPLAGDSCVLWSEAVRLAVVEARLDLDAGVDLLPADRRTRWRAWIADAESSTPSRFSPNGFTVTALQAAWSAIVSTGARTADEASARDHLRSALQAAVEVGDDTDTVAAIAGGLLGAHLGTAAVPAEWRAAVHGWPGLRGDDLVALARQAAAHGRQPAR